MDSDDVNFPIILSEKQSRMFACLGLKRTTAVPEKGSIHFMDRVGGRNFFHCHLALDIHTVLSFSFKNRVCRTCSNGMASAFTHLVNHKLFIEGSFIFN